jgi:putative ABC transport system substrate-binding protein
MRRRDFNMLLGGAAVALPCAALAQQPAVPVIGFLNTGLTSDTAAGRVAAFQQGFQVQGSIARMQSAGQFYLGLTPQQLILIP